MLYYFSPNSVPDLRVGVKSLTRGHYTVEKTSLGHVSAVTDCSVIQKYVSVSVGRICER